MIDHILARHSRIALEISGGKDSLAVAHLLREHAGKITAYWCNPGDPDPSVLKSIEWVRGLYPHFVEVRTDVGAFRRRFGAASSVVPMSTDEFPTISDQVCCMHNIMLPLDAKVRADGNTLVIRGQKACDKDKGQLTSGDLFEGVEFLYPVEAWSDDHVLTYLAGNSVPIPRVYRYSEHGIDCLHCSGWWKHGHMGYLEACQPEAHRHVSTVRRMVRAVIEKDLSQC